MGASNWFDLLSGTMGMFCFVYGVLERLWPETRLSAFLRQLKQTDALLRAAAEAEYLRPEKAQYLKERIAE